jgi:D-alanyl-D-alanine carboxypeptidase/D-alanyl-D-alanine-endopeptidase (penicillin-binding protein 4)
VRRGAESLRRHRAAWRLAVGSATTGLAVAASVVALAGPWDGGQRAAERDQAIALEAERDRTGTERFGSTVPAAEAVLAPLEGRGGDLSAAAVERALAPVLDTPALGEGAAGAVVDAATGTTLYAERAGSGRAPASTIKLITGVAALNALGPEHRLATEVVWDDEAGRAVLVGGGDPTLSDASLRGLAERAAEALAEQGVTRAKVGYDLSRYPGEEHHPIGAGNENIATITPLQVNEGRVDGSHHGPAPRTPDPAADAARAFAGHLADAGVEVAGEPRRGAAPRGAESLATHRSAPLSSLVERMLTYSDNDLAEAIGRATALATGHEADFRGVGRAAVGQLRELGLPVDGVRISDASGLDRESRVTAELLTRVLVAAADPGRPALRPVLTGLPVAGFTGTLEGRFGEPGAAGAGVVRAKTGTLTGVNTLAGTAVTPDGRVLVFAFLASDTTGAAGAQAALDEAATALATCACR